MGTTATSTPAELDSTGEIDAAWVQSVLASSYPGVAVRSVAKAPIGAGNVSDTVKVTIEYANRPEGAPDAVVAKFRPSAPEVHAHGLGSGAYHREVGAYRVIGERAACRIPHAYHVAGDETNINLVLEDLSSAVPGDQIAGCTPVEAEAVLTELAKLHATFSPLEDATAPAWPIRMADVCDYWAEATRTGADAALQRYRGRMSAEDLAVADAAGNIVRDWYLLPQSRLTLTHGDARVDNVMFEQRDGRTGAVILDWQVTGLRNPMYDVGYFLSGSLPIADRREHERRLIDEYLRTYATVSAAYGEEEAFADYRVQLLSGLMVTLAAIAVLPDNDVVNTLIVALLERNCAAARDWESIDAATAAI